jgi:hypothetical protein
MAVVSGTITVSSAGTAVQADHKGNFRTVMFKARSGNAGKVYIGGSDVSSSDGMELDRGDTITFNLTEDASSSQFWADAANNDDKVDFFGYGS